MSGYVEPKTEPDWVNLGMNDDDYPEDVDCFPCPCCNGEGEIEFDLEGLGIRVEYVVCHECGGSGEICPAPGEPARTEE